MPRDLSLWLIQAISTHDPQGRIQPPTAGRWIRLVQDDGEELTVISHGWDLAVYIGRGTMTQATMAHRTAARLGWWLILWWVVYAWCGLRLRLWAWLLERRERQLSRRDGE